MRIIYFIAASTMCFFSSAETSIFLLHGSFSTHSSWYRPGGAFFDQLQEQARQRNELASAEQIQSFAWSGGFRAKELISEGFCLAEHLLSYHAPSDTAEEITLIAHSNGGNVSLFAIMIISELRKSKQLIKRHLLKTPPSLFAPFDAADEYIKSPEQKGIIRELKKDIADRYHKLFARYGYDDNNQIMNNEYGIKALYLLGTPINTNRFDVATDAIEHVFNIYSEGDFVQPLAGKSLVPEHERCSNIHVTLHEALHNCDECTYEQDEGGLPIAPCHTCIHAPVVAQWLFEVPALVKNSENVLLSGELLLHPKKAPHFVAK